MTAEIVFNKEHFSQWDKFVANHDFGWICHLSGWKKVIEKSFGHIQGHFFVIRDRDGGAVVAGMPVYSVKSFLTGKRLVSVPFATLCDPLVSTEQQMSELIHAVLAKYKQQNMSFVEIRCSFNEKWFPSHEGFGCSTYFRHHYFRLDRSLDEIHNSFQRTSVKKNIKRACREELELRTATDTGGIKTFYTLYVQTRKKLGLPPFPLRFFTNLWNVFGKSGKVVFFLAMRNGTPVGALMAFAFSKRFSCEAIGWDDNYNYARPTQFLTWEAVRYAHAGGYTLFDFGRTAEDNTGLIEFKRRWGTEEKLLHTYFYPRSACAHESGSKKSCAYRAIRAISRKLPDSLFRPVGAMCYRHMG